ncbi:hypothetical protein J2T55_000948 [Methylohalomonas lacus]|uniref:Uncharacterized protein n=1 Tax=Methylohalomonas lacus TaxID=398773 RepID=A0AAE3HIG6_9GAMM|nr:hypothetical protein [Methylohalomonas lacus]
MEVAAGKFKMHRQARTVDRLVQLRALNASPGQYLPSHRGRHHCYAQRPRTMFIFAPSFFSTGNVFD